MRDFSRLLRPRNIAVVGGGDWCRSVITSAQGIGFQGNIIPVHPDGKVIAGINSLTSLADHPDEIDAVFVGINRMGTIDAVRHLRELGVGGAVCFASGFTEAKAEDTHAETLQSQLLEAAGDMPILGPNCYGFVNYLDRVALWPDQHGGQPRHSGVAIVTQSSNIAINLTMQKRGLPLAYIVTAGNQAQTTSAEIGAALLTDKRVTALGLHIEGFGDLAAYEALARQAQALGKTVVALKVGKSAQA
ncbi:MAG: CoA-binding protein, partial [Pseudomonadota bacterium]